MTRQQAESKPEGVAAVAPKGAPKNLAGRIPFPRNSLKEALKIAETIWKENAGDPFDPILLAKNLGTTYRSSPFITLVTSSERYGLTEGNVQAKAISMTDLARQIIAPTDDSLVGVSLRKALLTPKLFEQVYSKYNRQNIPREENVKATLERQFNVPRADTDACYKIFWQNIKDYGMSIESGESNLLYLDNLGKVSPATSGTPREAATESQGEEESSLTETLPTTPVVAPTLPASKQVPKQIFVAHGKNKKPLEQLKSILNQFKVPFQVAIDEPHKGRAISDKVIQLMRQCTSGIFIFTGDEETQDADGNTIMRPSDNVVFELGAGIMQYGDKIVIFREEGVDFGSDFTSYGHITFEKDKLDAKGLDLVKELIGQDFLEPPRPK